MLNKQNIPYDKFISGIKRFYEDTNFEYFFENNNACFEIDCDTKLIEGQKACDYSYEFKSIMGFGKIIFLNTKEEKITALNYLMKHQTEKDIKYNYNENELNNITVFKLSVDEFTGKQKVKKNKISI